MALERHTDCLPKRVLELADELKADIELNEMNLTQKSLACAGIKSKWQQIYCEEKSYLARLREREKAVLDEYVAAHGRENVPKRATEKEAEKRSDVAEIRKSVRDQEMTMEYLEGIVKMIIAGFNFEVKNSLELIKIENQ